MLTSKKGDCFTKAFETAQIGVEQGAWLLIAHGLPVFRGPEAHGERFWHAWVEVLTTDGWVAIDLSNGRQVVMPRHAFYRAGRLGNRHVWRYPLEDAKRQVDQHGTAGPWVDGWEEMGL